MEKCGIVALGLVLCVVLGAITVSADGGMTADDVLARMRANATAVEDFDAHVTVQTYADGEVKLTQELHLSLLQPNKMRQEYLAPEYFAGNLVIIADDVVWTYIAANATWESKDLSLLSDAEQPWLAFRQLLRDVQDELGKYAFALLGTDDGAYHLRGAGTSEDAIYGAIELWVNPGTFVPERRLLYDTDGNLLVDARILDVEEVAAGAYIARRLETYGETGMLSGTIVYDSVSVNQGLDPSLFALPQGASPR